MMELYVDPVATTTRAVLAMCEHDGLNMTLRPVALMKGEQHQPPLRSLNPNGLLPVLVDDGFVLTESSAILRYLARRTGSTLYPQDARDQARVDELMAWFETNFYRDFGYQFVYPQLLPQHRRSSDAVNDATVEWGRSGSRRWLDVLDQHYLGNRRSGWLCGDQLSLADLQGAAILSLGALVGCRFAAWPNVQRWFASVNALPAWQRANSEFTQFAASLGDGDFVTLDVKRSDTSGARPQQQEQARAEAA